MNDGGADGRATESFDVLGTKVLATTPGAVLGSVREAIRSRRRINLFFCTVSTVLNARGNTHLQASLSATEANVCPDGMPLVWLGRRATSLPVERVYGPDFMIYLFEASGGAFRHYFFGGGPGVAEEMIKRLSERFPSLKVAGAHSPPFGIDPLLPSAEDLARINDALPDIVWVGLGHPKQEIWAHSARPLLDAPVIAAVGAAFDFHAGMKKEAPDWMKSSGLQWLHRLLHEPRRLWKRYLVGNVMFVLLLIKEKLLRKRARRN